MSPDLSPLGPVGPSAGLLLYRVSLRPLTGLGFLASLVCGRGGDGAAIGDDWYHFRHGYGFCKDSLSIARRAATIYDIIIIRAATDADRVYLESQVGRLWKWYRNCFSMTARLWR